MLVNIFLTQVKPRELDTKNIFPVRTTEWICSSQTCRERDRFSAGVASHKFSAWKDGR